MRVVIVGAGVAGCVMARKLSQLNGMEVTCLERVSRDDHSEAGTGLNVGPNAVKALGLVDADLAERITQEPGGHQAAMQDGRRIGAAVERRLAVG